MQREFAAIALCILAQAASAQCAEPTAAPMQEAHAMTATGTLRGDATGAAREAARPSRDLIKTAAAGTRDDAPPTLREGARMHAGPQDHPRRGGTAMLLAALALMSGIALRRFGGRDQ